MPEVRFTNLVVVCVIALVCARPVSVVAYPAPALGRLQRPTGS